MRLYILRNTCMFLIVLLNFNACSKEADGDNDQLNAVAGNDLNVQVGQLVTLNGDLSADSREMPFEFTWRFIAKPSSSKAELQNNITVMPSFTPDVQGKYKIELTVSNNLQSFDTVTVAAFKVRIIHGNYENLTPGPDVGIRDYVTAFGELYATCAFSEIGGIQAKRIARYNGTTWNTVGCGLEDGNIYDMLVYKEDLYVTGSFEEIGCIPANNIARWDGNNWNDVEGGLTGGENPYGYTLAVFENELYVGGLFSQAGDVNAVNIASWDGSKWSAVGAVDNGSVRELQVYKQKLYAGGFFGSVDGIKTGNIAVYDGAGWSALGLLHDLELNATGAVKHMAVFKDVLYISGDFSSDDYDASELITWDGSQFNDFGKTFSLYPDNTINELAVINDILYIGGDFRNAAGSQANSLLQWDGDSWGIMGEGVSGEIFSIELYNNKIYIGGDYDNAGGNDAENISIWTADLPAGD